MNKFVNAVTSFQFHRPAWMVRIANLTVEDVTDFVHNAFDEFERKLDTNTLTLKEGLLLFFGSALFFEILYLLFQSLH